MHVYVETHVDEDGYPPYEAEEIDADELAPGLARISGIPVFIVGMARGDVVQYETRRDGTAWVVAITENSDHWTCRVISLVGENLHAIAKEFSLLGCDSLATPFGLVAVDVAPDVSPDRVMQKLSAGRDSGRWDFDLGVDPTA